MKMMFNEKGGVLLICQGGREKKGSYIEPGSSTIKTVVRPIGKQLLLRRQQSRALEGRTIMSW